MKKVMILFLVLLIAGISKVNAAEQYTHNTGIETKRYISAFFIAYYKLNSGIRSSYAKNGKYYTKFEDVWNYALKTDVEYENIPGGIAYPGVETTEVKYTKLKNICTPFPANPGQSTACAKLTVDVNGFNKAPNKYFSDTSTILAKDRFILYLYSNGVKAAKGSEEDAILMFTPIP